MVAPPFCLAALITQSLQMRQGNAGREETRRRRSNGRRIYERRGEKIGISHTSAPSSFFIRYTQAVINHSRRRHLCTCNAPPVFCVVFKRADDGMGQLEWALSNNRPLAAKKTVLISDRSWDYYSAICAESTERHRARTQSLEKVCRKKKEKRSGESFTERAHTHTRTEEPARSST